MLSYFLLFTVSEYMTSLDNFLKYTFTVVIIIDILFALIIFPFILRLSGQLLIQVKKCLLMIRSTHDPIEHIPYYEHYRLFFCVLLAIMCFNVFNLIKAFYLLKALFLYAIEPISLSIVLSFWSAFQDAIISFGIISTVQVMYFLNNKKFNFLRYLLLVCLRFVWMLLLESGMIFNLVYYYDKSNYSILISSFIQCESIIRFILIFRIAKEANDLVKMRINLLLNDLEVIHLMGHEKVENVYRASMVFRFLSWGNFILASLYLFASSLQLFSFFFLINNQFNNVYNYSVLLIELIYLLTSVLYAMFFFLLWKLYGSSRKTRFSGFSHFNQTLDVVEVIPILAPMTLVVSQARKIFLRFYCISIVLIMVIIIAFTIPLLITSWKSIICLKDTDYYMLNKTNLYKAMHTCSYVTASPDSNCQNTYFAILEPNSTSKLKVYTIEMNYPSYSYSYSHSYFWLPRNSTLYGFENMTSTNISMIFPTEIPCYGQPNDQEFIFDPILPSLDFDCLLNRNPNNSNVSSCNGKSCENFEVTYKNPGMINIFSSFDIYYLDSRYFYVLKEVYESSALDKKIKVLKETKFKMEYNIILNEVPTKSNVHIGFPYFACCITFICNIQFYYPLGTAFVILVTLPLYLFAAVIYIHRH